MARKIRRGASVSIKAPALKTKMRVTTDQKAVEKVAKKLRPLAICGNILLANNRGEILLDCKKFVDALPDILDELIPLKKRITIKATATGYDLYYHANTAKPSNIFSLPMEKTCSSTELSVPYFTKDLEVLTGTLALIHLLTAPNAVVQPLVGAMTKKDGYNKMLEYVYESIKAVADKKGIPMPLEFAIKSI